MTELYRSVLSIWYWTWRRKGILVFPEWLDVRRRPANAGQKQFELAVVNTKQSMGEQCSHFEHRKLSVL